MRPRYKLSELLVWTAIVAIFGAIGRALEVQLGIAILIPWLLIIATIERWSTIETALWISLTMGVALGIAATVLPYVESSPKRLNIPELLMFGFIFGAGLGIIIWGIAIGLSRLVVRITSQLIPA